MTLRPVVLSGPSGAGKSTLVNLLFKKYPTAFGFSISHTTRKPRPGEEDGKHYYFTTMEKMESDINEGKFIEHAQFSGNRYGTSKMAVHEVLKSNRICLLDIDEQGVKLMKKTDINPLYAFIRPPSLEVLRERLFSRGTENEGSIKRRMDTAESAIKYSETPGAYDVIIVNDDLESAFQQLQDFLLKNFPYILESSGNGDYVDIDIVKVPLSDDHITPLPMSRSNGDLSITEISLSPIKLKPNALEDPPAVVAIDTVDSNGKSLDHRKRMSGEKDDLIITDQSSAVFGLDSTNNADSAVCGRNGWCAIA